MLLGTIFRKRMSDSEQHRVPGLGMVLRKPLVLGIFTNN